MKVIIIEDEKPAAEKLKNALLKADPGILILSVLNSVQQSIEWLQREAAPDLIFMDIELSDGLSFKIFEKASVNCPVIFTTAYDEYWQEAFEHNSIDYLLKPIKEEKLMAALLKYEKLKNHFASNFHQLMQWQQQSAAGNYKKRFLVKRGTDYLAIKAGDVAYFYATQKLVCMVDHSGQKFILDKSLAEVEKEVDPACFYRLNRKYLANMIAIKKIKAFSKSKLLIHVEPVVDEQIIISQENAAAFKEWLSQ